MKHCRPLIACARRSEIFRLRRLALLTLGVLLLGTVAACYSLPSPEGWADPVFDGSTVYYSPLHGKLEAYDLAAHKVLWDFPSAQMKQVKPDAFYGTPVLDQQTVYTAAYNGTVYALSRDDGQIRWQIPTGAAIIGGMLLQNGVLYVANSDGHVLALRSDNGAKLWQQDAGRRVWSTPVAAGDFIVVTSMDSYVYAFNAQGGLAWKSRAAGAAIASTPRTASSNLTFGAFDKRYHAIDDSNGNPAWSSPPAGNWFWTQGLVSGDNLYAGNLDGHLYDYGPADGMLRWQVDLGAPIRAAPALAGGVLVVAARNGMIHGLDPGNGQEKWPAIDAGGSVLANLLAAPGNTVYAVTQPGSKTNAHLLQIDPSKGSSSQVIAP